MRRKLFTIMAALSLLLCIAFCLLWVCRDWTGWRWKRGAIPAPNLTGTHWELVVGRSLVIDRQDFLVVVPSRDGTYVRLHSAYSDADTFPGVHLTRQESVFRRRLPGEPPYQMNVPARPYHRSFRLDASYLSIAALCSILPLLWLWRRRSWLRRERIRGGLCPACGYDMRATPSRCPECGADARPAGAAA
ncbi:MAG TPA: hypothetical protein VGR35_01135 [Tepidisphaeraceae bacterium]|nr:hypothetical protein [Tepidisphaeraceae bacterium]